MNLSNVSAMRSGIAAFSLALCTMLAGQAHAAKAIQTGTIGADSGGSFSLPLNFYPIGGAWRGAVQFNSSTPVTSHVDMSLLQSLFVAPSHGSAFISANTITGSTDAATGLNYSSQFKLGGWPYHLRQHLVVAYYSNGLAHLVGQTTPGASVSYRMTQAGVPEPSTWALMILGLGGIGVALRKRAWRRSGDHQLNLAS